MSESAPIFRPYISDEMAQYEKSKSFRDFMETLSNPISAEEFQKINERISTPLDLNIFRDSPEGTLESELITTSYRGRYYNLAEILNLPDEEYFEKIQTDTEDNVVSGISVFCDIGDLSSKDINFVILDELKIKFGEIEIDVYSLIPKEYKVVLVPGNLIDFNSANLHDNYIFIKENFSSLGGLLTLLHEIGHVVNEDQDFDQNMVFKSENEEEIIIDEGVSYKRSIINERDASLYALKKLWKELRKNPELKRDAINYLKFCFRTYCVSYLINSDSNLPDMESGPKVEGDDSSDFFEPLT